MKIALVGAPSSRKSTISDRLNSRLKELGYNSEVAKEYARKYIMEHGEGNIISPWEQYPIAIGQMELEDRLASKHDIVICDAAVFFGYIYARMFLSPKKDQPAREIKLLKDLHEIAIKNLPTYDLIFLLDVEGVELKLDGVRYQKSEDERKMLYERIKGFLDVEGVNYIYVGGDFEERYNAVENTVLKYLESQVEVAVQ